MGGSFPFDTQFVKVIDYELIPASFAVLVLVFLIVVIFLLLQLFLQVDLKLSCSLFLVDMLAKCLERIFVVLTSRVA